MTASKLIRPTIEYKESFLSALTEYQAEKRFMHLKSPWLYTHFDDYVQDIIDENSNDLQPLCDWKDYVPQTTVWMVKDSDYIGTVEIRHRLNWHLEKWGGHLHFVVRPSLRGLGYGKKMFLKAIPLLKHLGIDRALLTTEPDNHVARHIIEQSGAVFEDETTKTDHFPVMRRYWLETYE